MAVNDANSSGLRADDDSDGGPAPRDSADQSGGVTQDAAKQRPNRANTSRPSGPQRSTSVGQGVPRRTSTSTGPRSSSRPAPAAKPSTSGPPAAPPSPPPAPPTAKQAQPAGPPQPANPSPSASPSQPASPAPSPGASRPAGSPESAGSPQPVGPPQRPAPSGAPRPRQASQPARGGSAPGRPAGRPSRPTGRVTETALQWACDAVGTGSLVSSLRLMSVSSTVMHAVDVYDAVGLTHQLALRRFHNRRRLEHDPWYSPANEATVLDLLGATRVPAPRLLSADLTPAICDLPALLTTRVPGEPPGSPHDLEGFLYGLAHVLNVIHGVPDPGPATLPAYRPYYDRAIDGERRPPSWSTRPKLWERAFEVVDAPAPATGWGFIHRDYHPGQTMWADDRLVGVVDWTTGCRGPYAIDLARMRLNLANRFGVDVAQRFAELHHEIGGYEMVHPYWDLVDATDVLVDMTEPEAPSERLEYARFEEWVAQAVAALG